MKYVLQVLILIYLEKEREDSRIWTNSNSLEYLLPISPLFPLTLTLSPNGGEGMFTPKNRELGLDSLAPLGRG